MIASTPAVRGSIPWDECLGGRHSGLTAPFHTSTFVASPGIINTRVKHLDQMVVSTTSGKASEWRVEEFGVYHVTPWL